MRNFCIAAVTAGLMFAPAAWAEPLAPGKPAGVRVAQAEDNTVLYIVLGAAVIAGIAIAASSGSSGAPASNGGGTTTTTGTGAA
jgi:hypothetical protein